MDKFGIFKLLNSFFNFYEQSKSTSSTQENKNSGGFSDFLSAFNSQQNQPQTQNVSAPNPAEKKPAERVLPPLQTSMLSTMNSHDEFIKRVKNRNNKQCSIAQHITKKSKVKTLLFVLQFLFSRTNKSYNPRYCNQKLGKRKRQPNTVYSHCCR